MGYLMAGGAVFAFAMLLIARYLQTPSEQGIVMSEKRHAEMNDLQQRQNG